MSKLEGVRHHIDNPQDENKLQETKKPHELREGEKPGESSALISGETEAAEWTPEMDEAAKKKRLEKEKREEEEEAKKQKELKDWSDEWGDEPTQPG